MKELEPAVLEAVSGEVWAAAPDQRIAVIRRLAAALGVSFRYLQRTTTRHALYYEPTAPAPAVEIAWPAYEDAPIGMSTPADVARDKPSRPGLVSQADSTAPTPGPFTPDPTRTPKPAATAIAVAPTTVPQPIGYTVQPTPLVIVIDRRGPRQERQAAPPPAPAPTAAPNVSGAAGRKR